MPFPVFRHRPISLTTACIIFLSPITQAAEPAAKTPTLETVVVTAERQRDDLEAERDVTPGAVTNLDGDKLHERNVTQLSEMLRYVPGVWSESYNGNDDVFYSSRGSNLDSTDYDKNGVKFLQDGLPVTRGGRQQPQSRAGSAERPLRDHRARRQCAGLRCEHAGRRDRLHFPHRAQHEPSVSLSGGSFGQWGGRATVGGASAPRWTDLGGDAAARWLSRSQRQDRKAVYANLGWQASDNVSTRFYANYRDSTRSYRAN